VQRGIVQNYSLKFGSVHAQELKLFKMRVTIRDNL